MLFASLDPTYTILTWTRPLSQTIITLKRGCINPCYAKKQFNSLPVRLQMQYCIVECDYNRAVDKDSEAKDCVQKGLNLQGGKKFQQDLEARQS